LFARVESFVMSAAAQRSTPTSTAPVRSTAEIRALVRRQKVDQRATLDIYFRTAEHVYVQVRAESDARGDDRESIIALTIVLRARLRRFTRARASVR
jgi:hypothetical protein